MKSEGPNSCAVCGKPIGIGEDLCAACSQESTAVSKMLLCPSCNASTPAGYAYCVQCGAPISVDQGEPKSSISNEDLMASAPPPVESTIPPPLSDSSLPPPPLRANDMAPAPLSDSLLPPSPLTDSVLSPPPPGSDSAPPPPLTDSVLPPAPSDSVLPPTLPTESALPSVQSRACHQHPSMARRRR